MATESFDQLFSTMLSRKGADYIAARDAILLSNDLKNEAMQEVAAQAASGNWQTVLAGEILLGWIDHEELFATCKYYMQGNLPGRRPLPGFTVAHRAKAIADMGPSVTPRILEMLWKSQEYDNFDESSSLLAALKHLLDRRAVEPLIELVDREQHQPEEIRTLAVVVLAALNGDREFDFIENYVSSTNGEDPVRQQMIIGLGEFRNKPAATETLQRLLVDPGLGLVEHRSAAQGMRMQPQAYSREKIMVAIEEAGDEVLLLHLIAIIGQIGTPDDIEPLKRKVLVSEMVGDYVEEAIEEINSR